jgi:hypothetical protein
MLYFTRHSLDTMKFIIEYNTNYLHRSYAVNMLTSYARNDPLNKKFYKRALFSSRTTYENSTCRWRSNQCQGNSHSIVFSHLTYNRVLSRFLEPCLNRLCVGRYRNRHIHTIDYYSTRRENIFVFLCLPLTNLTRVVLPRSLRLLSVIMKLWFDSILCAYSKITVPSWLSCDYSPSDRHEIEKYCQDWRSKSSHSWRIIFMNGNEIYTFNTHRSCVFNLNHVVCDQSFIVLWILIRLQRLYDTYDT